MASCEDGVTVFVLYRIFLFLYFWLQFRSSGKDLFWFWSKLWLDDFWLDLSVSFQKILLITRFVVVTWFCKGLLHLIFSGLITFCALWYYIIPSVKRKNSFRMSNDIRKEFWGICIWTLVDDNTKRYKLHNIIYIAT